MERQYTYGEILTLIDTVVRKETVFTTEPIHKLEAFLARNANKTITLKAAYGCDEGCDGCDKGRG